MNPSLSGIPESLKQGLLRVSRDGVVRHVNTVAGQRTGLSAGRRLFDPDLVHAVAEVVQSQAPKAVKAIGVASRPGLPPASSGPAGARTPRTWTRRWPRSRT